MTNVESMVARVKRQFDSGYSILRGKRMQWPVCADRITSIFEEVRAEAKKQELFESLYVLNSRKDSMYKNGPPMVTMWWGRHPLGSRTIDEPNRIAVEGGACLTFSQGVDGSVLCVIYPFGSELHSVKEKYLVLKVFEKPCDVTTDAIYSALESFFSYSLMTSVLGLPTKRDIFRISLLRFNGCRKGKYFAKFIKSIGSALLAYIKSAHPIP